MYTYICLHVSTRAYIPTLTHPYVQREGERERERERERETHTRSIVHTGSYIDTHTGSYISLRSLVTLRMLVTTRRPLPARCQCTCSFQRLQRQPAPGR